MPCTMIHVREVTRYFLAASLEVPAVTEAVLISLLAGIYYIGFPNNFFFSTKLLLLVFCGYFPCIHDSRENSYPSSPFSVLLYFPSLCFVSQT